MSKLGLKLWSTNIDHYFNEAQKLYEGKVFDYIELYVVPNSLHTIEKWAELEIPFALHAPHFMHEVNLADRERFQYNKEIFAQVDEFSQGLNTTYTVIHGGMNHAIEETVRQVNLLKPRKPLIENKPYKAPLLTDCLCRGATLEEVTYVMSQCGCGFCLDIGHAICTANSLGLEPYSYLEKFETLNPACYHLSDNFIESDMDMHLHLNEGNYDFPRIFSIINTEKPIAIETKKDSKENLNDFREDVICLKNFLQ